MLRVQLSEAMDDVLEVLKDPTAKWSEQVCAARCFDQLSLALTRSCTARHACRCRHCENSRLSPKAIASTRPRSGSSSCQTSCIQSCRYDLLIYL